MNFTQSFEEFSKSLTTFDFALYLGAGLVLWVLFKDKLQPAQKAITDTIDSIRKNMPTPSIPQITVPSVPSVQPENKPVEDKDIFFNLILSWKRTRDLAVQSKCPQAVEMADQMFPFLSPNVCDKVNNEK